MSTLLQQVMTSKKDKAFYSKVKAWLYGEDIDELELAVELSSMLTHSLIEIKEQSKQSRIVGFVLAQELHIDIQSKGIKDLIYGFISKEDLRLIYLAQFGEAFDIRQI